MPAGTLSEATQGEAGLSGHRRERHPKTARFGGQTPKG